MIKSALYIESIVYGCHTHYLGKFRYVYHSIFTCLRMCVYVHCVCMCVCVFMCVCVCVCVYCVYVLFACECSVYMSVSVLTCVFVFLDVYTYLCLLRMCCFHELSVRLYW